MFKRFSVAEARDNLAAILHELENLQTVEITRRGQSIAVLLSKAEYERMQSRKKGFWNAYQEYTKRVDLVSLNIDPAEIWSNVRDRTTGREMDL